MKRVTNDDLREYWALSVAMAAIPYGEAFKDLRDMRADALRRMGLGTAQAIDLDGFTNTAIYGLEAGQTAADIARDIQPYASYKEQLRQVCAGRLEIAEAEE